MFDFKGSLNLKLIFKLDFFLTALQHYCSLKLADMYVEPSVSDLPLEYLKTMIQSRCFSQMCTEDHLLDMIIHRHATNNNSRQKNELEELLPYVRWGNISESHLIYIY